VPFRYLSMNVMLVVMVHVVYQQVLVKLTPLRVPAESTEPGQHVLRQVAAVRREGADKDVLDVEVGKIERFLVEARQDPPIERKDIAIKR